jgi:hypothetical protein
MKNQVLVLKNQNQLTATSAPLGFDRKVQAKATKFLFIESQS